MSASAIFRSLALLAILCASAYSADTVRTVPTDLVIRNVKAITVDASFRLAESVAIRGDRIVAVGREQEMAPWIGPSTKVIDGTGKFLLPGLYDSHVHPLGASSSEADHAIPAFDSLTSVMTYIAGRTRIQPKNTWIVVRYAFRLDWLKVDSRPVPSLTRSHPIIWSFTKGGRRGL